MPQALTWVRTTNSVATLKRTLCLLSFTLLLFAAVGCGGSPSSSEGTNSGTSSSTNDTSSASENKSQLTIGVLPYIDYLPVLVADREGYFEEHGLDVSFAFFKSALDRDNAYQSGDIDGAIGDIIAAANLTQSGVPVKTISLALGATPEEGVYTILASPKSSIRTPSDLAGKQIAISSNSSMEYVVDMLLAAQGFSKSDIPAMKTAVNDIALRFQLLMQGDLEVAILPDPLATLAESQGAIRIIDDSKGDNLSQAIHLFRAETLEQKPEAIQRYLDAYNKAVAAVNENPESYRPLLEEELRLPPGLDAFAVPQFSSSSLPKREDIERALNWMNEKGLLHTTVTYEELMMEANR